MAQVSGALEVSGLTAPVRIVRDRWGVPHIYAQNRDDLFFAQGFVQAQDRLFQMDLWRRAAQGRLSEVLGPNFVARDVMTRRMQYRGSLAAEWASYGPDTQAIAAAFVRGINAWVTLARDSPPEPFVLAGWTPGIWAPADLLNRTDAFASSGDAVDEIFRARLVAALGAPRVDALLSGDRAAVVAPGLDLAVVSPLVADAIRRAGAPPLFLALASPVSAPPVPADQPVKEKNAVAIARALDHPSPRYLVHLNAPGWNVIGATAPWLPGVAAGHNERVAWSMTAFDADTQDVYVEKLNPSNAHQVEDEGKWTDTAILADVIHVKGRPKPFTFDHERTRHGVIVASDKARNLAYAVQWSGSEPGTAAGLGALALDTARSAPEFRAALVHWKMPPRIVNYQDVDGASASQAAAWIPVRAAGNGALPVPGWTRAYDWRGWRTLDDLKPASTPSIARRILDFARAHSERADMLLRQLRDADSLKAQQTLIADTVAELAREREAGARMAVTFAHPLAVTAAARSRFNIGPLDPPRAGTPPFALAFNPSRWDRTSAINAPGQSESPDSPHFADLAVMWSAGDSFALPFSERAVQAGAETTLTLTPRGLR